VARQKRDLARAIRAITSADVEGRVEIGRDVARRNQKRLGSIVALAGDSDG
jgi:hypothetical protein